MKTLLICHEGATLDQYGLSRWLTTFSDFSGLVVIREPRQRFWRRVRREIKRVGPLRILDVAAFRCFYFLFQSQKDLHWKNERLREIESLYPKVSADTPMLYTSSPNTSETEQFIRKIQPDIMIARCKVLLKESIFSIPSRGTFVMHPGICPEYRNAHGCFWALANDELDKVGMTLLRIDKGIDTGPTFGYYTYPFDELNESHDVIQHRVVLDNLEALKAKLIEIYQGSAIPVDTSGRRSGVWGQPWLTSYLKWKFKARRRSKCALSRSSTTT